MFGFRQKLVLGFGGLLAMLLIVSALGVVVLSQYRSKLDQFYYENWRSVDYGQNMVDSLERLGDLAKDQNLMLSNVSSLQPGNAQKRADPLLREFDKNLDAECHNITLPGEREIAEQLSLTWSGHDLGGNKQATDFYRGTYAHLIDSNSTPQGRAADSLTLDHLSATLKGEARKVIRLNLENMKPIDGQAKLMADRATGS